MVDDETIDYFDDVDENFEQEILGEGKLYLKIINK